jgi:hypothetical protein
MSKITKKEYEEEIEVLKEAGLTEDEIESYFEFFDMEVKEYKTRILNFGFRRAIGKLVNNK